MKKLRLAIVGFRHAHISDLWERTRNHPQVEVVACCEEHPEQSLLPALGIKPTHDNFERMLSEVEFDILGIGDYYSKRGRLALRGLECGKHIIADKPLCTSLDEFAQIKTLLSKPNSPKVGLQLDLRSFGNIIALRAFVRSGRIGEPVTVSVAGQHPLLTSSRPGWYFEPGKHGGTLNDIAIHALDFIPWITGSDWRRVVAARTWNGKARHAPYFNDCAQFIMELENGAGVIGDVSYLAPDGCGYASDLYWRIVIHGTAGLVETSLKSPGLRFATDADAEFQTVPGGDSHLGKYLDDFLADVHGTPAADGLATANILRTTQWALQLQSAADRASPLMPSQSKAGNL